MSGGEKPDAWMPLYVADWDAGTRHLTCEEDGAYGRLVRYYWKNGPPPDDDGQLARIVGLSLARWRRVRLVLLAFFQVADGRWIQGRVEAELVKWTEKRRRAIERASAGGRAKAARRGCSEGAEQAASSTAQAVLEHCTPSSAPPSAAGDRTPLGILSPSGRAGGRAAEGAPPPCAGDFDGEGSGVTEAAGSRPVTAVAGGKSRGPAPSRNSRAWPGPPDIRALVVAARGEAYAASYLDPSGWLDGADRRIIPRTGAAAERMRRDLREVLEEVRVRVGERAA